LKGEQLLKAVTESDALITRSGTAVTRELVNAGTRLRIVGRAGVGLDNVDVDACTERGILVINAQTANILSATEHTMAMLLALCRNIPEAHASVKRGEWVRSKFMGIELSGKRWRDRTRPHRHARHHASARIRARAGVRPGTSDGGRESRRRDGLADELRSADVIIGTPLSDETRGMLERNRSRR
jgi:phosphoglycerate dehydrogenase-like enzyme